MFPTPYWEHVTKRVHTKFSHFLATFRAKIGQCHKRHYEQRFPLKNSRWRRGKQRSDMKIKGKLRSILRLGWTTLKTSWCKKMRIYKTSLKLASSIHIMLRKNALHSRQKGSILEFLTAAWSFFGITKNYPYVRKKLLATAGNLKVNQQSNYRSAPFFIPSLGVKIDTSDINFLKAQLSLADLCNFYSLLFET